MSFFLRINVGFCSPDVATLPIGGLAWGVGGRVWGLVLCCRACVRVFADVVRKLCVALCVGLERCQLAIARDGLGAVQTTVLCRSA